ncbi:hypothetical protein M231_06782 [Tremella mesenterica]|uniref:Calcofluor white hypersensitive protein n=1 Tax=Tremella mesenterica TaxID=5217 RepID=A0A4Q1BAZ3_TREME|nr:hypothetical protein M231_06782 [Tremella mesenterica]
MSALFSLPATYISRAHTGLSVLAFASALTVGWAGGYWHELCTNAVAEWPTEWFPSVSATIGDHAGPRAPFHILIALCATPRFLLLLVQWLLHRTNNTLLADMELVTGLMRTFCCGGWMYITSRDNHDLHDFFMIVYLLLNLPWMFLSSYHSPYTRTRRIRWTMMIAFISMVPFLMWHYYRHSVLRIPGAYTVYAFFEWSLVVWDIAFDAVSISELGHLRVRESLLLVTILLPPSAPRLERRVVDDWKAPADLIPASTLRAIAAWVSDVYFGVCFWTVFTSLGFQLFYWSVWKLALSGSELALLANLSPFFLVNNSIRELVTSRRGQFYLRSATVIFGMGCYCIPIVAARLLFVSLGTASGWLVIAGSLSRLDGNAEAQIEAKHLGLGITVTMLIKYINFSTNPFWCLVDASSGGWNLTGLFLASLSLLEYRTRPLDLHPTPSISINPTAIPKAQSRIIAFGLGSLIHLLQTFLSDAGTVISWTWTGYPLTGPTLHPYAAAVILAALAGVIFPQSYLLTWLIFPGSFLLYFFTDWWSFMGGLLLTTSVMSLLPTYFRAASALQTCKILGQALVVNCVLDVASVVTAAYAFVPLGWLLRERTDLVLSFCAMTVVSGAFAAASLEIPKVSPRTANRRQRSGEWNLCMAGVIGVVAIAWAYGKIPREAPVPYFPEYRMFSAGIWTVHFGVDQEGRDSQWRMMDLIRDMEVDIVGLLETDLHRFVYGNRDLTRVISEELGYYVDLGPGPDQHTWGAALLSKFPIINSTHHLLPSPNGELAPAIHATLDIHGTEVDVMVSHNGQEEDALDRELQTTELARLLREREGVPTVFIGYLVTKPHDKRPWPYEILKVDGKMHDIEPLDTWRWCEYIFFRHLYRIAYARLEEGTISDTELQVGKFLLPLPNKHHKQQELYANDEEMYWHIGEADIPEPWRMPRKFWGDGVRGHKYRIWVGPVYYLPPERSGLQDYGRGWKTDLSGDEM